ncbi:hypothetical protein BAC2_00978 [uncultured bacterium]|nr:hypothetical protein BAC2_00978 [uncultured bacterium]
MTTTQMRATRFLGATKSEIEEAEFLADILREPDPLGTLATLMEWLPESAFDQRTTGSVYTRLKILAYELRPLTLDNLRETLVRFPDEQVSIAVDDVAEILAGARHE